MAQADEPRWVVIETPWPVDVDIFDSDGKDISPGVKKAVVRLPILQLFREPLSGGCTDLEFYVPLQCLLRAVATDVEMSEIDSNCLLCYRPHHTVIAMTTSMNETEIMYGCLSETSKMLKSLMIALHKVSCCLSPSVACSWFKVLIVFHSCKNWYDNLAAFFIQVW